MGSHFHRDDKAVIYSFLISYTFFGIIVRNLLVSNSILVFIIYTLRFEKNFLSLQCNCCNSIILRKTQKIAEAVFF